MTIDNLQIPYEEKIEPIRYSQSDLKSCTRMEFTYQPSILEYYFPYMEQRRLLSNFEKQHLQSQKTINVNDQKFIRTLAGEIMNAFRGGEIVTDKSITAQVVCYRDDDFLTSFSVINNQYIENKERQSYWCYGGLVSMRMFTPQMVQPFQSRIQCATNLKDIWYRLRLYNKARQLHFNASENIIEVKDPLPMAYPTPKEWCDNLLQAFRIVDRKELIMKAYKCPAMGEGECNYAMNPNCESNSPGDMVLLFETKAGWNQHGGPELFTFDNHDPKGGCVLLNNGTVKFIRTKEELNALKWK